MKRNNRIKRPSVTVALSAYNEADNIQAFLKSVIRQKRNHYRLKQILVISDGSSDETVKLAKSINSPLIRVKAFRQRRGKSLRLNWLYQHVDTDVLIQSDADVVMAHDSVLDEAVKTLLKKDQVKMIGGNPQPLPAETFIEQAVNATVHSYLPLRHLVRKESNIFSADGRFLGFKKEFYKKLKIPATMIANDAFAYFCCKQAGYGYAFASKAMVLFRSPQTLKDQIRQNTRFVASPLRMKKYFSETLVDAEYFVPKRVLIPLMIKQFLRYPIHCGLVWLINRYCQLRARKVERNLTAQWDMAFTTKHLHA